MIQNLATLVWFLCNIQERMGLTKKKSVPQRIPVKITKKNKKKKKKKPGGESICKNFGVNGSGPGTEKKTNEHKQLS